MAMTQSHVACPGIQGAFSKETTFVFSAVLHLGAWAVSHTACDMGGLVENVA